MVSLFNEKLLYLIFWCWVIVILVHYNILVLGEKSFDIVTRSQMHDNKNKNVYFNHIYNPLCANFSDS